MPDFTAKDIQALRKATGAGMLDAKRALEATDGDPEEAAKWLRTEGLVGAAKRQDREAAEGAVVAVRSGDTAALVELRCETDFVAKSDDFLALGDELADAVLTRGEDAVAELADAVDRLRTTLKENISVGQVVRLVAAEGEVVDTYQHNQNGRGKYAAGVVMRGGSDTLAHDVAVHIVFAQPTYLRREDVPASEVEAERALVEEISRKEGKPEAALPKIVEGRMTGWFKERCLLEQNYIRDEKQTVGAMLGAAEVVRFALVSVGS